MARVSPDQTASLAMVLTNLRDKLLYPEGLLTELFAPKDP